MTKLARQITRDEVAAYRHAGVVLLRGVLDLPAVNTLRRSIDQALMTMQDASPEQASSAGKSTVMFDIGLAARLREFRRFTLNGPGPEIAAGLLGGDQINFFGDQIFVKEPGTRERTAFHQDAGYFEIAGEQCCVLWIPVDPVTIESGSMMYWRGSHKSGAIYPGQVIAGQNAELPDIESNLDGFDIVHFDVEPGDMVVHHYRTVHGAAGNASRYQVRRAASLRYCGDDIRFQTRSWTPGQFRRNTSLKDGDPLSGTDFPVVWRRRTDQQAA